MIHVLPIVRQRTVTSPSAPFLRNTGIWAVPTDSLNKIPLSSKVIVPGSVLSYMLKFKHLKNVKMNII